MDKIVHLLRERNKFLTKFSALNSAEMTKMTEGKFETLEDFYNTREGILQVIKQIELMIEANLATEGDMTSVVLSTKRIVSGLLKERDQLVSQILMQDLEILSVIDQAKNTIIHELQDLRKNRKVIGSYKSGNKNNILDEEI